ncbi:MAG: metal-dependent hydrolase [Phycisphaerae bacterium]
MTQGLLGAATAQLGFRQRIGRDATWIAFGAGAAADLDIFVGPLLSFTGAEVDEFTIMQIHRGPTHSLLLAPLLALPIAFGWWYFRRKILGVFTGDATESSNSGDQPRPPGFPLLYACILVAFLSHAPLDYLTAYGTQLFSPLTDARYALNTIGIIDIIFTPLLILTLLVCYVVRKFRGGSAPRGTLIIGWVGFALAMGYLATGRLMHNRAVDIATRAAGDAEIIRADAYPQIGTIFLWRAVLETPEEWISVRVHHFSDAPPQKRRMSRAPKHISNEWIEKARGLRQYEIYEWFAMGRLRAEYRKLDGVHVVVFHDMRYSRDSAGVDSMWPLRVEFDSAGELLMAARQPPERSNERGAVSNMWRDIWDP